MPIRLENIERGHWILLATAGVLALVLPGLSSPSVLLGGMVMGVNFWIMRQLFSRLLSRTGRTQAGVVGALVTGKFVIFLGLIALLFVRLPLDALSFSIGASLLLVTCVGEALRCQTAYS